MIYTYTISDTDRFQVENFPEVVKEITELSRRIGKIAGSDKAGMVISFLKDHCLNSKWLMNNRSLANVIISHGEEASHAESLFACCRGNKLFLEDLEAYVKMQIT